MGWKRKRLGLALGAGGARGIAHVGALRVFEEESIPIDLIVGSSIGALVGGAFASGLKTSALEKKIYEFLESPLFVESALISIRRFEAEKGLTLPQKIQGFFKSRLLIAQSMFKPGMLQNEDFQGMIDFFIPDIQVEETQILFRPVATDLVTGQPVIISRGSLRRAVMASCAVPGAVSPIAENGKLLADGGIIYMVPTIVAREAGAEFVVGIGVNCEVYADDRFSSAMDVYVRATNIGTFHLENRLLSQADVVIRPRVGKLHWTDFHRVNDLIEEGERATWEKRSELQKAMPLMGRSSALNFLYNRRKKKQ
jgi:NTE family protein